MDKLLFSAVNLKEHNVSMAMLKTYLVKVKLKLLQILVPELSSEAATGGVL